jgi:hypothetical protein
MPPAATSLRGELLISTLPGEVSDRFEDRRELAADEGLLVRLD